jgi:hypothetical protein
MAERTSKRRAARNHLGEKADAEEKGEAEGEGITSHLKRRGSQARRERGERAVERVQGDFIMRRSRQQGRE